MLTYLYSLSRSPTSHLYVAHAARQKVLLNGLSFSAKPGQKVAFVGKAGCGKSTAIDLLQRLYTPTAGEILVDGRPIQEYDTRHLRRHCGVAAQRSVLFERYHA